MDTIIMSFARALLLPHHVTLTKSFLSTVLQFASLYKGSCWLGISKLLYNLNIL